MPDSVVSSWPDPLSTLTLISGFPLTEEQREALSALPVTVILEDAAAQEARAIELVSQATVWFGPGLTPRVFKHAHSLRWMQTASVGVEYFLFPELVSSELIITNMRGRHGATSEHALALILSLARQLPTAVKQQAAVVWKQPTPDEVIPVDGTTLLIVGTGQIGQDIAMRAAAFGMNVHGVNRAGSPAAGFARVWPIDELTQAISGADWIVNAVPLTDQTAGLFSRGVFDAMKTGAVFVNVGRGKTVDQAALVDALRSGRLRGAALDVFQTEPLPADDPLWDMPSVVITPHSAGVIPGSSVQDLGFSCLMENLDRYFDGSPPRGVDKVRGY